MLKLSAEVKVYVCLEPVDMRKAVNGLSALVVEAFSGKLTSGDLYLFMNKKRDTVKCLYWHRNGFVLHYKRLEKHKFVLPIREDNLLEISEVQLQGLLAGLDYTLMQAFSDINYEALF